MEPSISSLLSAFSIILVIISVSSSPCSASADLQGFLECLPGNSNPSIPISDVIYTQSNSSYTTVLRSYVRNLRYWDPSAKGPLLIVAAAHESHVQATVICAKLKQIPIRIRSGGHDYDGLSYATGGPFILIDMFNLRAISIDLADESAWVESGAILGELYYKIAESSKTHAFPAGICFGLGVGGHLTGGGYGNLMRKYGLSIDNVVDAKIVNAKGEILDRKSMGEDLFWAIRGGGAASFGVILSWKVKLVPVPATVTVFKIEKTVAEGAKGILLKWQQVADKIDQDLFVRALLEPASDTRTGERTVKVTFMAMFLGDAKRLTGLIDQSFPELGLQEKDCLEMSWIQSVLFWMGMPKETPLTVMLTRAKSFASLKRKSDYVQEPIPEEGLESIFKSIIENESVAMNWNPYGGKMSEIGATETAFPHRGGNIFKIQYSCTWQQNGTEVSNRFLKLTNNVYEAMTPYVSKSPREAFLNYRDIDIGTNSNGGYEYGEKYFKGNFERLTRVKTEVDPDDFFRYEQSVPLASAVKGSRKG